MIDYGYGAMRQLRWVGSGADGHEVPARRLQGLLELLHGLANRAQATTTAGQEETSTTAVATRRVRPAAAEVTA